MASGINNTFRQVGIATGIAAMGAIFQSQIASHLRIPGSTTLFSSRSLTQAIASGQIPPNEPFATAGKSAFIAGLNSILLVAAIVLFVGAVLAVLLVREKDFVASGPAVAGH
jgi:hypothetical protein